MAGAADNSGSFDPRTWPRGRMIAARLALPVSAPGGAPIAVSSLDDSRRQWLAGAGSALLLGGGGLAAWQARAPNIRRKAAAISGVVHIGATRKTVVLSGPSDLQAALLANEIDPASATAAAQAAQGALKPGEIRAVMTLTTGEPRPRLTRLEVSSADSSGVVVTGGVDGGFTASPVAADLTSRVILKRGTMDADSFYSSAVAAGVTDSLIPDFAQALAFDFDFQREVRKGDVFEAAFEQAIDPRGEAVGPPRLLFAALTTKAKSAAVYRFTPPGKAPAWFDEDGRSNVRALLRTPVDAAHVSSGFGFRLHPIMGFMKLHKGTDFAAPVGTPIFASGDGQVEFAGPKGPNGNFVQLRHDNGWESLYLHMNRFADGVVTGARVRQGQQIGEVGTTGQSTGPHLHYELHVKGEAVDPLTVKTESGISLAGAARKAFVRERDRIDVSRASQSG